MASGVVSLTIARGSIFAPLRAQLTGWRADFASCWLCLGAWASASLTTLQGVDEGVVPLVAWLASWGISTLLAASVDALAGSDDGADLHSTLGK